MPSVIGIRAGFTGELGRPHARLSRHWLRLFQALHLGLDIGDLHRPPSPTTSRSARETTSTPPHSVRCNSSPLTLLTARALDVLMDQFTGKGARHRLGSRARSRRRIAATLMRRRGAGSTPPTPHPFGQLIRCVGIATIQGRPTAIWGCSARSFTTGTRQKHTSIEPSSSRPKAAGTHSCHGPTIGRPRGPPARRRAGDDRTARELCDTTVVADTSRLQDTQALPEAGATAGAPLTDTTVAPRRGRAWGNGSVCGAALPSPWALCTYQGFHGVLNDNVNGDHGIARGKSMRFRTSRRRRRAPAAARPRFVVVVPASTAPHAARL